MSRSLRIVAYAVNGSGVGHLTRLVAVMRWVRRYAAWARVKPEIVFLSSSEADGMLFAERFASFKLPSKTIVADAGLDKLAYLALAKQWVWHSLGLLRPDLFVVDTFPRGAFGELLSALDLAKARGFIYRPMKESFANRPDFQAMLPLYDRIVVPDEEESAPVLTPPGTEGRVRWVGPITARENVELLPRTEARRRLGVADEAFCVYVTAGGGGDPGAPNHLESVLTVLESDPSIHLVVGAGPLYRGAPRFGPRLSWLTGSGAAELMPAFDLAIGAAGYNTFHELLQAGVPTLFVPQPKIADEQDVRARRAVDAGAAKLLASLTPQAIVDAVNTCRDASWREQARAAALTLRGRNGAREAAARLLELVVPGAEIEAAQEAIDDTFLVAGQRFRLSAHELLELVDAVSPRVEGAGRQTARRAMQLTTSLLDRLVSKGVGVEELGRVLPLLGHKLSRATPEERSEAMARIIESFHSFGDWNGAQMVLRSFATEKELDASTFADGLVAFLDSLQDAPTGLYEGLSRLSAARGQSREPPTNAQLLRAVGAGR